MLNNISYLEETWQKICCDVTNILETVPAFNTPSGAGVNGLLDCSLVIGIVSAVILLILSFVFSKVRIDSTFLKVAFFISWFFSFVVYDIGMVTQSRFSLITNAPMAVIHAFSSFLFSSDVSEIREPFVKSWVFMTAFSWSHALSAFVSALFIIKIFGFNFIQRIRLYLESIFSCKKTETYVFWGYDDITHRMVESIKDHYGNSKKTFRIVVVKTAEETDDCADNAMGFQKILEILSLKNSELEQLHKLGCYIAFSVKKNINSISGCDSGSYREIFRRELKMKSLSRLLTAKKTSGNIHLLFLSDNQKQNLHDVSVLLNDKTLRDFSRSDKTDIQRKVTFYCHARYNGVHRVIEDQHCSNNLEVKLIDSSHLNVEQLKRDPNVLPVNFVDVEKDATVSSTFNAMVIGFSEVGQDVTRFLYEYGAFVKSGIQGEFAERSSFHLDVIDNKMKDKAGPFVANAPAIAPSLAYDWKSRNPNALIELHNEDCRSVEFYNQLKDKIKALNYIVVATEDDELNMTIGVRIFRAATRYRNDMNKLCILIRIHNDDDGHFSKIADYYNRLWAAQESVFRTYENEKDSIKKKDLYKKILGGKVKNTDIKQDEVSCILPLYIFGQDKMVYTYDNIIDNTVLHEAIDFKEEYVKSTSDNYVEPKCEYDKAWYDDIKNRMQTDDDYHPVYASVMCLRRNQGQDLANSLHKLTKEILRDNALAACGISSVDWTSISRYSTQTSYHIVSDDEVCIAKILDNLAKTEHLRWNASHEILGYVYEPNEKDEIRLKHDCLKIWDELDEYTQSFDHNVVDLSFGIQIIKPAKK